MGQYEFPQDESIDDHIPDGEIAVSVEYSGGMEYVTTEERSESRDLEELDRQQLYEIGDDVGADLTWSGEDADTEEEMRRKITEAKED